MSKAKERIQDLHKLAVQERDYYQALVSRGYNFAASLEYWKGACDSYSRILQELGALL